MQFFSKNISIYAIFNDQSFKDTLTNNIISFEQLGPDIFLNFSTKKYLVGTSNCTSIHDKFLWRAKKNIMVAI